jgi:hypothetical protein
MTKTATLLSIALGVMAGWFWGDEVRRRKHAEAKVTHLSNRLEKLSSKRPPAEQQLNKIAIVLNDAHKKISAVSKALLKPAS